MNYWTIDETAKKWGITPRQVRNYCAKGRIYGAMLERGEWRIPADAAKPAVLVVRREPLQKRLCGFKHGESIKSSS